MRLYPWLYLISSLCFILSLQGLSSAATARKGNFLGMAGMAIAIVTALTTMPLNRLGLIAGGFLLGGGIGTVIALRIQMVALPQLVAAFHSLVGLAAIAVVWGTFLAPHVFHLDVNGALPLANRLELGLGTLVGAVTFTGSLVAFLKLQNLWPKQMSLKKILLISGGVVGVVLPIIWVFAPKDLVLSGNIKTWDHYIFIFWFMGLFPIWLGILCWILSKFISKKISKRFSVVFWGIVTLFYLITFVALGKAFLYLLLMSGILGIVLIAPIGGADMPVIVSMLNSYSGWATCATGFTLGHPLLIITGALVGASGAILSFVMCKNMNRSLIKIMFGVLSKKNSVNLSGQTEVDEKRSLVKISSPQDCAFLLKNAGDVIIVPGYGMAVAQAQHAVNELTQRLKSQDIRVRFAVHPVAGRMPGHMNVLLAEAKIPYTDVFDLDEINHDFAQTDVVLVIGANDITNPAAHEDPSSLIFGMPVLDVEKAKTIFFVKRSLGAGYAGVENELFYKPNTFMLLGDAKKVCEALVKEISE